MAGIHKSASANTMLHAWRFALCTLLTLAVVSLWSSYVYADEIEDAQAELAAKTTEIEDLTNQLAEAKQSVERCQGEMQETSDAILASQEELSGLQKQLAGVSRLMYKDDGLSIWQIVSSSTTIDELLSRVSQLEAVASQAAQLSAEEKRVQDDLAIRYDEINTRKDEAIKAQEALEESRSALEASAAALEERIAQLEEEARIAAEAAAAAAALEAAQQAAREAEEAQAAAEVRNLAVDVENASEEPTRDEAEYTEEELSQAVAESTNDQVPSEEQTQEASVEDTPQEQEEQPVEQEEASGGDSGLEATPSGDTSGWSTGIASAYGGSSDPNTPNPGTTATGAVCDDYSTGVAVPISWGPKDYYGRLVEISYNGMTVVATVNDCGGMGGGSRSLDLQPGVFKAFGFSTCQDWGLREVQYRFL